MRRAAGVLVTMLAGVNLLAADDKGRTLLFGKADLGKVQQTGKGENSSIWNVEADDTAPSRSGYVLAQTAQSPKSVFNLCVFEDGKYKDVEVSVAFKAVKGKEDQGGDIVWRYQDADNYYLARMNPLEDNYRVYKVVAGKRTQFQTREGLKVPAGEWHMLRITDQGDAITCSLDGTRYLEVTDDTFPRAGKVGLWTKADGPEISGD
jgi:FlaG/FlaF family flagellin (archaellin)